MSSAWPSRSFVIELTASALMITRLTRQNGVSTLAAAGMRLARPDSADVAAASAKVQETPAQAIANNTK